MNVGSNFNNFLKKLDTLTCISSLSTLNISTSSSTFPNFSHSTIFEGEKKNRKKSYA
jgi:hypothetical protein